MSNGVIDIRENEFSEIQSHLNKSASNLDSCGNSISSSFKDATDVGLLSKTTNKINKQMSIISNQINRINKTVASTYDNMSLLEKELTNKANEIVAPTDFYTNDTSFNITINAGNLDKEDGKSINSTNETNKQDLEFKKVIDYNESLKKIVKEYENKNGEIDIAGDYIDLVNVKKDQVSIDSTIDDYSIRNKILNNINKEINDCNPEFDDKFEIKELNLKALKNIDLNQINYDDLYLNIKKEILEKLNNGNYVLEKKEIR